MYIRTITALSAAALAISACGGGGTTWQEDFRAELDDELSAQQLDEVCGSLVLFELDTPEKVGAMIFSFDDGQLPNSSMTVTEFVEENGGEVPDNVPSDTTMREIVYEAGDYILEKCGLDNE